MRMRKKFLKNLSPIVKVPEVEMIPTCKNISNPTIMIVIVTLLYWLKFLKPTKTATKRKPQILKDSNLKMMS